MIIKANNGKTSARKHQPKSAPSSSQSKRSMAVPKNPISRNNGKAANELDGNIVCDESRALQSETSAVVLEKTGIIEGTGGTDLPSESVELTAITLHQPWASLIAKGKKHYETRSWATDYRGAIAIHAAKKLHENESLISLLEVPVLEIPLGAVVAIAELTDCILMDEDFILKQSSFEQYLGLWEVGRYAWKLENVRAIKPITATGKQGLWKWDQKAASFNSLEIYPLTVSSQQSTVNSQQLEPWNPTDFGELQHIAEADGQLNLLQRVDPEPPEPDDYEFREQFEEAYKEWAARQTDEHKTNESKDWEESKAKELKIGDRVVENLNNPEWGKSLDYLIKYGEVISDIYPGKYEPLTLVDIRWDDGKVGAAQVRFLEKVCNLLMDGLTCVAESAPASPMPESNCGSDRLTTSASGTAIAEKSLSEDSPELIDSTTSKNVTLNSAAECSSLVQVLPAPPSQLMEIGSEPTTPETFSPTSSEQSENSSPTSQLSKTSPASSLAPIPPATNLEPTSDLSSTPYPRAGTMRNGVLSAAPILPPPGVESASLLLRSPGGLSGSPEVRPPGKSRLETQLNQLGLIQNGEVVAPEFLELGYNLPVGWTNPQEKRTAIELAQVQAQQSLIDPKSELPAETATTAIEEQPWAMPLTGESQPLGLNELNISVTLPPNIGALSKAELIGMAQEQHQLICVIERKEFELAIEKLHRVRLTGIYLQEFKKKCQYGEFENQLEQAGIGIRSAQNYMAIAKNWDIVEAKTKLVALLTEENQPVIGLKWALEAVRDEKKQLKSAAPPKDPDSWRTPNTKDQPIVDLVKKALGGTIWLDPCSDSGCNILATMRYFKWNDGLAKHNTWNKTVFINPPFSDPLPWVERCCFEIARGNVSAAVMLLKSGTISNLKTGELINKYASAICHWRGRINFLNDEGNAVKGSDFDCVFIYFGARLDLFRQAFGGRGTIATIENHYSSVNKKFLLKSEVPEFGNTQAEQKQLAAAVGLGNGRSVLPDMRDADRERNERYDPHTVVDVLSSPPMPTTSSKPLPVSENLFEPLAEPEIFDETPLAARQFETAKQNTLNDYITAISSNLSDFSDEQIAFLAKIINEESVKRIGF